uniref:Uncharacterized protein n=1 Tax=Jaculus jaculus TaxID=51337 RepID=A0A8C5KIN9_JACJA
MDPGKDEEGVPQPSRKKFVIPLDEDEVPAPGAKSLFRSTRNLPTEATSAQAAPQTYAEYAISRPPPGPGAGDTGPTGSEPSTGETPNQALKPGAKTNSIIVSPRQPEEAGRYLETYKAYEQKPADLLMEKLEQNFLSRARRLFDVLHEPFLKVPQ